MSTKREFQKFEEDLKVLTLVECPSKAQIYAKIGIRIKMMHEDFRTLLKKVDNEATMRQKIIEELEAHPELKDLEGDDFYDTNDCGGAPLSHLAGRNFDTVILQKLIDLGFDLDFDHNGAFAAMCRFDDARIRATNFMIERGFNLNEYVLMLGTLGA